MKKNKAAHLLDRYIAGNCTPEERRLVEQAYNHSIPPGGEVDEQAYLRQKALMWQRINSGARPHRQVMKGWLPYAAALVVFSLVGSVSYVYYMAGRQVPLVGSLHDVDPGGNRAVLTLADGRSIDLSADHEGIIIGDEHIQYPNGERLIGDLQLALGKNSSSGTAKGRPASHVSQLMSIATPKGGTYQITLSDGTKVWLNAGSTLTYPSHFSGSERTVELSGEAYFEVRPETLDMSDEKREVGQRSSGNPDSLAAQIPRLRSHRPFKVLSKGQRVEVLGTQFNITAYADEPDVKTTLVEGAVIVSQLTSSIFHTLSPGQRSTLVGTNFTVEKVDVESAISWKNGFFYFTDKRLREVMLELERWYDIEVIYEGMTEQPEFYGKLYRSSKLSTVLEALKDSGIDFRLEKGGRLVITGK